MDFLFELLVQLIVQFVVQVIFELLLEAGFRGAAAVARSYIGRLLVGAVVGLGFGFGWGSHLSGGDSLPKLFWVSLAFAASALIIVLIRAGQAGTEQTAPLVEYGRWSWLRVWPWRWASERLVSFAVLNVAFVAGIAVGFSSW